MRNEEAKYAFEVLGTNAVGAVPELIRIYEEEVSPSSQSCAALALGNIGRGAQPALPALIRRFTDTNSDVRFYAVSAVMRIGGEPEVVLPALTSALKDSNVDVRWNALVGLSMLGARARPAVPEILKMLSDPGMVGSDSIIPQVEISLWRIAPEKIGKPLVVEEATPMIGNGVTTEALRILQGHFLDPEQLHAEDLGKPLAFSIAHGMVFVEENFFGVRRTKSLIDTGDLSDGGIDPRAFQLALVQQHLTATNRMNTGSRAAHFPAGEFAGETYHDFLLAEERSRGERSRGFIGPRFLARHVATFNFPKHTLYLKRMDLGSCLETP